MPGDQANGDLQDRLPCLMKSITGFCRLAWRHGELRHKVVRMRKWIRNWTVARAGRTKDSQAGTCGRVNAGSRSAMKPAAMAAGWRARRAAGLQMRDRAKPVF